MHHTHPETEKAKRSEKQAALVFDEGRGLSTENQQYLLTATINEIRRQVDRWRNLTNPNQWQITPETARLLRHWRRH